MHQLSLQGVTTAAAACKSLGRIKTPSNPERRFLHEGAPVAIVVGRFADGTAYCGFRFVAVRSADQPGKP
jgi:hypothetical protein